MELQVRDESEWKIISYVQIAVYILATILVIVLLIQRFTSKARGVLIKQSFIFIFIFNHVKVAGAICMIVFFHQTKASEGLTIATYILNNASLGFLMKSVMPIAIRVCFDEFTVVKEDEWKLDQGTQKGTPQRNRIAHLMTLLVTAGIVTTVVGSACLTSDISTANSLFKASGLIFLAAVVIMTAVVLISLRKESEYGLVNKFLLVCSAFLLIRCIYSVVSAFAGMDIFSNPSKYVFLFGEYQYYCFIAFIEEILTNLTIISTTYYLAYKVMDF
ncbi:uncharacterized protein PRCAT00002478001 [Priceomyces carsonii]|uniref:uncharacterized protein n=1 Tax=Priceomyces carsonii TaxID=28549 RepID=UPI002EDA958A|nr:unnamed protein product [Priceomyces carsonii]